MQKFTSDNSRLVVLRRGEELIEQLTAYARDEELVGAWMQAIGGAAGVTLGYYDLAAREYQWTDFDEPLEILGLQGNVALVDGQPFWHIHGTFGRADSTVIGGHVKRCVIGLTGEIHVMPADISLVRTYDDETGLKLLCPSE